MKFSVRKNCLGISLSVIVTTVIMSIVPIDLCDINKSDEPVSYDEVEQYENDSYVTFKNVGLSIGNDFLVL